MAGPLSGRDIDALAPLDRGFYQRGTVTVARGLLGKLLVRRLPDGVAAARITEVEAYLGVGDPAAHTSGGRRTARNETMWGEGGRLYVYFTYGMHFCSNVVTRRPGVPEAVLLRGGVAVAGEERIAARRGGRDRRELLNGPAKLCRGLGIDRALDGADLTTGDEVWLASDGFECRPAWVRRLPRVGVAYAGDAASWPLRFLVALEAPAAMRRPRGGAHPDAGAAGPPGR